MTKSTRGVGDEDLAGMIAAVPRVLRRGVVEAWHKVDAAAQLMGVQEGVPTLLARYRDSKRRTGVRATLAFGLYPQLRQYVQRLDDALAAVRTHDPADYVSEPIKTHIRIKQGENQKKRRGKSFPGLEVVVAAVVGRPKYLSRYDGWIAAAVQEVRVKWATKFPEAKVPSDQTVTRRIREKISPK